MTARTILFAFVLLQAVLLAFEVYLVATTGLPVTWAAAVFIGVMLVVTLVNFARAFR